MHDTFESSERRPKSTLKDCLDILGPVILRPLVTPRGVEMPLRDVVIAGDGDPLPPSDSGMLLLAGTPIGSASAVRILERIAELGYVGAVIRPSEADQTRSFAAEAERVGLALFDTPSQTPWRHLSELIATSVSVGSVTETDVGGGAGDLFSLANSIASQVGGAITIEDPHGRVLAYSSLPGQEIDVRRRDSILERHSPDRPENTAEYRRVIQARGKVVRFDFPDPTTEASRLAVAVQAGSDAVGVIFALDHRPPLAPDAEARLEEAARLTALHILRSRAQQDPQRWAQAEALRTLLDGAGSPEALQDRLGEVTRGACAVVAIAAADENSTALTATRAPEVLAVQCRAWKASSVTTSIGETVYGLLPIPADSGSTEHRLRRFASEMIKSVDRSTGQPIKIALGPVASEAEHVLLSRRVADRVLAAMDGHSNVVSSLHDVRSRVVLMEIAEREFHMLDYYGGPVDKIISYDNENGTDYAETLLAYLDAFGKTDVAAKALVVHENTLRYRIRRLSEIFELDLEQPDDRLLAWLQLRILPRNAPS